MAHTDGESPTDRAPTADALAAITTANAWVLTELPRLNRAVLDRSEPPAALSQGFTDRVLATLPPPGDLDPLAAQRLVVLLGLTGASIGRHFQESDPSHRAIPERAFDDLVVGSSAMPFFSYFGALTDRTGTGHCHRDAFASLVRWNVPAAEVWWDGQRLTTIPSIFDDGLVRTYTAAPDERRFFGLLKASEVLELAVNQELLPLSDGSVPMAGTEAIERMARATGLLVVLRRVNAAFTARPQDHGLRVAHFMDVFRQYAVHWVPGDTPPSGAMDPEALARDLLLGIAMPGYADALHRIFPGLLDEERRGLQTLIDRDCLPTIALARAGITPAELAEATPGTLARITTENPVLAVLYLLLDAHARMAGVHLAMTKKFLFNPQRRRDAEGLGDPGVVSNRTGTTGLDERRLEALTAARKHHVLGPLHQLPPGYLEGLVTGLVGTQDLRPRSDSEYHRTVRFPDAVGGDLGLPEVTDGKQVHDHDPLHSRASGTPVPAQPSGADSVTLAEATDGTASTTSRKAP